ncbi:hypothetical protein SNEBB_010295 [Seison nebaliae]|nr:hypothetical protein SNEBB_010295 [Seison nebaliae]
MMTGKVEKKKTSKPKETKKVIKNETKKVIPKVVEKKKIIICEVKRVMNVETYIVGVVNTSYTDRRYLYDLCSKHVQLTSAKDTKGTQWKLVRQWPTSAYNKDTTLHCLREVLLSMKVPEEKVESLKPKKYKYLWSKKTTKFQTAHMIGEIVINPRLSSQQKSKGILWYLVGLSLVVFGILLSLCLFRAIHKWYKKRKRQKNAPRTMKTKASANETTAEN